MIGGVAAAKARGVQFGQPKKIKDRKTVRQMKQWRRERVSLPDIQRRLRAEGLKISVTTIEKYISGKVKL